MLPSVAAPRGGARIGSGGDPRFPRAWSGLRPANFLRRENLMSTPIKTDALIIGAGPAGLFQVFELGLREIAAHVIDALPFAGGQCVELYGDKPIYDIPALPACTGRELTDRLLAQVAPFALGLPLRPAGEPRATDRRRPLRRAHARGPAVRLRRGGAGRGRRRVRATHVEGGRARRVRGSPAVSPRRARAVRARLRESRCCCRVRPSKRSRSRYACARPSRAATATHPRA